MGISSSRKETISKAEREELGYKAEALMIDILRALPGDVMVEQTSKPDDEKQKIDLIVTLGGGKKFALQVSAADSPELMRQKLAWLERKPVIEELHDDSGQVVSREAMPVGIAGLDMLKVARNPESLKTPSEQRRIIESIVASMNFAKQKQVGRGNLFEDRIAALRECIKDLAA